MQRDSSPQSQPSRGSHRHRQSQMDVHLPVVDADPTTSSSLWDWGDLLDFAGDDRFELSFDSEDFAPHSPLPPVEADGPVIDRVRKRDPRMSCSNFLAGRVPCACPEVDEKLEEEEAAKVGAPSKKRARTVRGVAGKARCQVPDCEADITELKGYHRRHRVCLRCANATTVLLDGQTKRYCQQCGKFHVLSDFDEGKRSCRRKLERHNKRRRRKAIDSSKGSADKEDSGLLHLEEIERDHVSGKDDISLGSQLADQEAPFEAEDGCFSALGSARMLQNVTSDNTASGDADTDGGKDDSKFSVSPSYCYNKTAYSSMCPTGRISFKLYDWNPAEFPRRLRHQIFQWLANMPVELEGYIRPGCTILTVFISMPKGMWMKLSEHPLPYLHNFVHKPGRMLYGRGFMTVYLNDMIFRTMKDGTSLRRINMELQAPKLHFVHPLFFEAGKPMEFIACGSNLLQSKFRFLVSFAGKYLAYDLCAASTRLQTKKDSPSYEHQLYKLHVPHTEPDIFGPAFIEVENESGLSNFVPVLIGDTEICSEMKSIQQKFDVLIFPDGANIASNGCLSEKCEASTLRQTAFSEFVLDVAWLLKGPTMESFQEITISSQIQRINCLLNFLIQNESTIILKKILLNLTIMMEKTGLNRAVDGMNDLHMQLFQKYVDDATDILYRKLHQSGSSSLLSDCTVPERECCQGGSEINETSLVPPPHQGIQKKAKGELGRLITSTSVDRSVTVPLLDKEVVMDVNLSKDWPRKTCSRILPSRVIRSRPTVLVVATATVCFGICVVYLHPQKVGDFAVTIRRCLFD